MIQINRKMGWKPDLPDHRDLKYGVHPEMSAFLDIPNIIDMRPSLPPIKDQGQEGSCVSNGTALALEFVEMLDEKLKIIGPEVFEPKFDPISRHFIYWNARALDGDPQGDNGTQIRSAIIGIRSFGICRETVWPFTSETLLTKPSSAAYLEGVSHKVITSYRVDNTKINQLIQCLAIGYPIVFGATLFDSFMSNDVAENGMVPMPSVSENIVGGHCMTIVGYDQINKWFIVANSWGTTWGDNGFCYIPMTYLTNPDLATDFWTIRRN